jgi:hypothetical protein
MRWRSPVRQESPRPDRTRWPGAEPSQPWMAGAKAAMPSLHPVRPGDEPSQRWAAGAPRTRREETWRGLPNGFCREEPPVLADGGTHEDRRPEERDFVVADGERRHPAELISAAPNHPSEGSHRDLRSQLQRSGLAKRWDPNEQTRTAGARKEVGEEEEEGKNGCGCRARGT